MGLAHTDVVCIGAGKESCSTLFISRDAEVDSTAVKERFISLGCQELHAMNEFSFSAGKGEVVALEFCSGPVMRC